MSDAVLSIEGLTAGYDKAPVIRDLELTVGPGEVVALLGSNGAGKTTTLRVISGLIRPMSGRVVFAGEDLARVSPTQRARRGIAHVPEGRGIFYGLTVSEHFRLGYGGERPDEEAAYAYFPKLADLRTRRVGLLSGGEQQMLAIARGLARRPRLLLLDELSLGLAPLIVESLLPVVHTYAIDSGCGVLLVEQHIQLALEIADRGYVLSHGEIVLHDRAKVLQADRELLISSYLGEQQVPIGDGATGQIASPTDSGRQ
jgi:ABC-type branched-subunit amino acid transport system ATPase component